MKNPDRSVMVANLFPNSYKIVPTASQAQRIEILRRLQMGAGLEGEGKHVGVRDNRC